MVPGEALVVRAAGRAPRRLRLPPCLALREPPAPHALTARAPLGRTDVGRGPGSTIRFFAQEGTMTDLRTSVLRAALTAATTAAVLVAPVNPATATPSDAALARQSTAGYHDADVITHDSDWFQLYDQQGITCIDNPAGGMGIHFVNGARVGDPSEVASEPEAVLYEPTADGGLRLVAVEYVVTKQAWDAAGHVGAPQLFGQPFELVAAGNRYGLPDFYELHAWIWKHNPAGLNEDWNPNVTCAHAS